MGGEGWLNPMNHDSVWPNQLFHLHVLSRQRLSPNLEINFIVLEQILGRWTRKRCRETGFSNSSNSS